ncbi:MAG: DUF1572 family protein [Pyrinomonadaceae bacterium]|nr:DUF1572 family protein [Pyrinomonadaceae bacterium]
MKILENYLEDSVTTFRSYKKLAEKALAQVSDEEFFFRLDGESNSIAIIVKHISGNMRSRWTDFLTTDGEKADRHRDTEFELTDETRESLMDRWDESWEILFASLRLLTLEDFEKTVTIRGEAHTVAEAINRQLTHYAYHIGQITFLAKHFRSENWKTLSVPKNKSNEFNEFLARKKAAGDEKSHPLDAPMEFSEDR